MVGLMSGRWAVLLLLLTFCAVMSVERAALSARESPHPRQAGLPSLSRANGVPDCEGLVEEVGDRSALPPWAIGWLMSGGRFVSVFRFSTRRQAESCAAGTEFVVRRWDSSSRSWKSP